MKRDWFIAGGMEDQIGEAEFHMGRICSYALLDLAPVNQRLAGDPGSASGFLLHFARVVRMLALILCGQCEGGPDARISSHCSFSGVCIKRHLDF
jgi:hypothetical protein